MLNSKAVRTALEALSSEAAVAIENARLYPRGPRAGPAGPGAQGGSRDPAVAPPGRRTAKVPSSQPPAPPCRAARFGATFSITSKVPGEQFGFILGDVAGKGAALGAAGRGGSRHVRCGISLSVALRAACRQAQSGPGPAWHPGPVPDGVLRDPWGRRLAPLFQRWTQRAAPDKPRRRPSARDRRHPARPLRAHFL